MMALLIGVFGGLYTRAAIAINEFRAKWAPYSKWWVRLVDCAMVATITAVVLCVRISISGILVFFFLFLLVMSLVCLSLSYPFITACLHSLTPHDTSLTTIPISQSIIQSIIDRQRQQLTTLHSLPYRYCPRYTLHATPLPASTLTMTITAAASVAR